MAIFVVLLPKTSLLNTYLFVFKHTVVFTKLALILLNYINYNHQPIVEQSIYVKLTWLQRLNWLYSSFRNAREKPNLFGNYL